MMKRALRIFIGSALLLLCAWLATWPRPEITPLPEVDIHGRDPVPSPPPEAGTPAQ